MTLENEIRFKLPKLFDANGDLNKRWFVYYYYFNKKTFKLERYKVYGCINLKDELQHRYTKAGELIKELSEKLSEGLNPSELNNKRTAGLNYSFYLVTFIKSYLNTRKQGLRRKTVFTYESKIRHFIKWINEFNNDIELIDFDRNKANSYIEYLRGEGKSNTTVNNYIIILKSLFDDMVNDEVIEKNPFNKIKKVRSSQEGKLPFKTYQKELLKEKITDKNYQLWLFVKFLYYCFIRPGELRNLRIESIDIDQGTITIDGSIAKNKKTQAVVIPLPLQEIIRKENLYKYPGNYFVFGNDGKPGKKQRAYNYFCNEHRKITRELEFSSRYTLYSWKSTGAVDAVRAGLGLKDIQLQLRHSSLEMTDIYLKSIGVLDNKAIMNKFPEL
jgi:integrase